MAIDSAEKRRSAAGIPFWPLSPGVTPNADTDAEWRFEVAWSYGGLEASVEPATGALVPKFGENTVKILQEERTTYYIMPESTSLRRIDTLT